MKTKIEPQLLEAIEPRRSAIQKNLLQWGQKNFRQFPWRTNRSPYSVLISEILLKRTTASAVGAIFKEFMELYPNPQALSKATRNQLEKLLSRIGYHKKRAENLIEIAAFAIKRFNGEIPRSKEELLEIPYVGDYTANAILSLGYGVPTALVDSNVTRIIERLFSNCLPKKSSHRIIQKIADDLAPEEDNQAYNLALLDFGALVCTYGIPKCKICPLDQSCDYYLTGKPYREMG